MSMYLEHMSGLKQLEREVAQNQNPALRLVATLANQALERRLIDGMASEGDIQMLCEAAGRAK